MPGLGRAMRQFTAPNEEPAHEQLCSLLQSGVEASAIVAQADHPSKTSSGRSSTPRAGTRALTEHATILTIPEPAPAPREVAAEEQRSRPNTASPRRHE